MNKAKEEISNNVQIDPITILEGIKNLSVSELDEMDIYYMLDLIIEIGIKLGMLDKDNRVIEEDFIDLSDYDLNKLGVVLLHVHDILMKLFQHYEII